MIISLVQTLRDNTGFLQQVLLDFRSFYYPLFVEVNVDILSETRGIVVSYGLGIAECYEINIIPGFKNFSTFLEDSRVEIKSGLPSKMGFASKICCSIQECLPLIAAKYCKISFVLSVLPAPLSPLRHKYSWI